MSGYIGATPVPQATQHREAFTATASQTSFATVGYTPQFVDVYLNGVKLAAADYTATNGSDIVLTTGAAASDILEYVAYTPFEVADQTFTGTTTLDVLSVTGAATGTDLTLSSGVYLGGVAAANKLDDYEEGTWTPTIRFGGASVGIVYSDQLGRYTKVGNLVTASCYVKMTSKGSSVGISAVGGLPFPSLSTARTFTNGSLWMEFVTFADYPQGYANPAGTTVNIDELSAAGATSPITNADFANNSAVMVNITYRV
tara:strand:- start:54 stop:824 length:771 start_codon:yes stop_codon:yes gene_type:complete